MQQHVHTPPVASERRSRVFQALLRRLGPLLARWTLQRFGSVALTLGLPSPDIAETKRILVVEEVRLQPVVSWVRSTSEVHTRGPAVTASCGG